MEGVPIGRKLDLLLLDGYDCLLTKLCHMFKTSITYADVMEYHQLVPRQKAAHVLTYEDQDGDWMMVGDVPWELFLTSVKKLRIARTDKC
uniref:Auxin-responsive protein n=1 Tax=Arundo donax TaxID=35708 RepID=A0A0A9F3U4_ARUDO